MLDIREVYPIRRLYFALFNELPMALLGEERVERRLFKDVLGYEPDLDNPKTLNEKMCWLKLHDHRDFCTMVADKYRVRDYIAENFGEQYLVPLVARATVHAAAGAKILHDVRTSRGAIEAIREQGMEPVMVPSSVRLALSTTMAGDSVVSNAMPNRV